MNDFHVSCILSPCFNFVFGFFSIYWRWEKVPKPNASVASLLWMCLLLVALYGTLNFNLLETHIVDFSFLLWCVWYDSHFITHGIINTGSLEISSWGPITPSLIMVSRESGLLKQHREFSCLAQWQQ